MKQIILNIILLFTCNIASRAIEEPEVIYKSPEAMSFLRQGQFQVGEYTGSANISFPLHTIKYKDIELPITLSYNSSGVQVAAEASWVGLNWDINIGGCINLIPCGGVDALHTRKESNATYKSVLNKRSETDYYLEYNLDPKDKEYVLTSNIVYDGLNGLTESDIYSVSLPSGSFHFYINRETGQPEIIGADCKNKVEKYLNLEKTESWKVTDSNGYIYEFECPDRLPSQSPAGKPYTSAWFLTKITSPLGVVLTLNYTDSTTLFLAQKMSEQVSHYLGTLAWAGTMNAVASSDHHTDQAYFYDDSRIAKKYIANIVVGNQEITFNLSDRDDLEGGKKLDSFCVREFGGMVKTVCFDYDYFHSNNVGGDYLVANGRLSSKYAKFRLKLKSFYYKSATQDVSDVHSFDYIEDKGFPNKNSYAVDMWGYYNGKENNIDGRYTFCPAPRFCDIDENTYDEVKHHNGANRFADADYIDALSLKRITYPTKGYTEFTFEPHTFMMQYKNPRASGRSDLFPTQTHQVQDVNFVNNSRNSYATGPIEKIDFSLNKNTEGVLKVKIDAGSLHLSNFDLVSSPANVTLMYKAPNQPYIPLQKITISTSSDISKIKTFEKEIDVKLPAGDYMFYAELPYNIKQETGASVIGILTYDVRPESQPGVKNGKIQTIGGGIRIRSIKNYDSDNTLLQETDYEYVDEEGYSSGIHILPNRFYQHQIKYQMNSHSSPSGEGGSVALAKVHRLLILDTPLGTNPFVSSINNNNVGYSRVVKKEKDGNRVQVSTYRNEALAYNLTSALQEINQITGKNLLFKRIELCTQIKPQNGNLLTQRIYDNNGELVHSVINDYSYTYKRNKVNFSIEQEGVTNISDNPGFLPLLVTCYSFENYWIRLASSVSTDYTNGIPTTQKETTYQYDPKNLQTSQIDENTSIAGQIRRTKIKYSADLTDNVGNNMRKANRLNDVVENKIVLVENGVEKKTISTQQTEYSQYYPYLPISQLSSIGSYSPEVRVKYGYDAKNNIRSIIKDGMETVYLWSYNGQYPIAKIEGLTYSEVDNALKSDSLSIASLSGYTHPNATVFNKIRTAINNIGGYITTYTYIPLVGIETETKANGLKTTYQYDGFGRLIKVLDHNGKVISTNEYNYKK